MSLARPSKRAKGPGDAKKRAKTGVHIPGELKSGFKTEVKASEKEDARGVAELSEKIDNFVDCSDFQLVDHLKGVPDWAIVKLKDGRLAVHRMAQSDVRPLMYVGRQTFISSRWKFDVIDMETDTNTGRKIFPISNMDPAMKKAVARYKEILDKERELAYPEKIDVAKIKVIKKFRKPKFRAIVKFPNGTTAMHNMRSGKYFAPRIGRKGLELVVYNEQGEREEPVKVSELGRDSKKAFNLMQNMGS